MSVGKKELLCSNCRKRVSYHIFKRPAKTIIKDIEIKHLIRIMRLSVFFVFVLFFQLHAVNMHSQEARITITRNNLTFGELITEIERQTD